VLGHIEVQDFAPPVRKHQEHIQDLKPDGRHREEVDRDHLCEVILQKRLLRLGRRSADCPKNAGDGALRDFDAEHLQFVKPR